MQNGEEIYNVSTYMYMVLDIVVNSVNFGRLLPKEFRLHIRSVAPYDITYTVPVTCTNAIE